VNGRSKYTLSRGESVAFVRDAESVATFEKKLNALNTKTVLHYAQKFSSYITDNTECAHYKYLSVNMYENNGALL
jgi:hypothetical protein